MDNLTLKKFVKRTINLDILCHSVLHKFLPKKNSQVIKIYILSQLQRFILYLAIIRFK